MPSIASLTPSLFTNIINPPVAPTDSSLPLTPPSDAAYSITTTEVIQPSTTTTTTSSSSLTSPTSLARPYSTTGVRNFASANQQSGNSLNNLTNIILAISIPIIAIFIVIACWCWMMRRRRTRRLRASLSLHTRVDPRGSSLALERDTFTIPGHHHGHRTAESLSLVQPVNSLGSVGDPYTGTTTSRHGQQSWSSSSLDPTPEEPHPSPNPSTSTRSTITHHHQQRSRSNSQPGPSPLNLVRRDQIPQMEPLIGEERVERIMTEMNNKFAMLGEKLERLEAALRDRPPPPPSPPPLMTTLNLNPSIRSESPPQYVSRNSTVRHGVSGGGGGGNGGLQVDRVTYLFPPRHEIER